MDQIEESQITSDKRRHKKTIKETIKNDIEINELERNMIHDI